MGAVERLCEGPRGVVARLAACALLCVACAVVVTAQRRAPRAAAAGDEAEFGPIVRAYLGYLKNQQEVVDDRVSRREIDRAYYVRNSNRIHALRQMAVRIARETNNDYLPELEAVAQDEFGLLFDLPPELHQLQPGELLGHQFRYLGAVASGRDEFYVFARLDPYEQAELRKQNARPADAKPLDARPTDPKPADVKAPDAGAAQTPTDDDSATTNSTRPRRVGTPPR